MTADTATMDSQSASEGGKVRLMTLASLDRRTASFKAADKLRAEFVSDMGGPTNITTAQRELVGRAALLAVILADLEARYLLDGELALDAYLPTVNSLKRVLQALGLERRACNVTPDPLTYARERADA